MKVEQLYTGCLAEAAYYIESAGEAIIIDPLRDNQVYIDKAEKDGAKIKYIFETHFHADFVSGHVDLARKTGAQIVYGPTATAEYDFIEAEDNQEFQIGKAKLKVLHTPGHTMESSTYLLFDEEGKEHAIFTGDTLFLGDVGRPDLAIKSDLTRKDLAAMMFDSLRNRIMVLPDHLTVYPGHGAGSACGKNMSSETVGTLGEQKQTNYALRADMTKEEFIEELLDGILPPPQYFPKNAMMNKRDIVGVDEIAEYANTGLNADEFELKAKSLNALILDTRKPNNFVKGFVPGSVFIGIDGSFATWVGTLITDIDQNILVVADEGREEEVVTRLARVGYDHVKGFLKGGFDAWKNSGKTIDTIPSIPSSQFVTEFINNSKEMTVLDVRKIGEYQSEHVEDAINAPLDYINNESNDAVDKDTTYHVHCAGGYRSVIYASIMKNRGFDKLINVEGGYREIGPSEIPTTDYVCPSQLN